MSRKNRIAFDLEVGNIAEEKPLFDYKKVSKLCGKNGEITQLKKENRQLKIKLNKIKRILDPGFKPEGDVTLMQYNDIRVQRITEIVNK